MIVLLNEIGHCAKRRKAVHGGLIGFRLAWHEARRGGDWDDDDWPRLAWHLAQQAGGSA